MLAPVNVPLLSSPAAPLMKPFKPFEDIPLLKDCFVETFSGDSFTLEALWTKETPFIRRA